MLSQHFCSSDTKVWPYENSAQALRLASSSNLKQGRIVKDNLLTVSQIYLSFSLSPFITYALFFW